jgi:serine/threonine protein phosphatase 1
MVWSPGPKLTKRSSKPGGSMVLWLRSRPVATPSNLDAAVPDGFRVYAVGDIHGRADLLGRMAEAIGDDLRQRPVARPLTIFLGDYVDRGPSSAQVIDRLARGDFPVPMVTLMGNHEDIFRKVLDGSARIDRCLGVGGEATFRSYRLDPRWLQRLRPGDLDMMLRSAIPVAHRLFLDRARFSFSIGDYFFCHAGARPGVPLERQSEEDLIWIREEFLLSSYDFGKIIVHGHTPVREPEVRRNAINVDTKAFASGVLTAVVLEGRSRRFLQARI